MTLIEKYDVALSTPECDLTSSVYKAEVSLDADISEALPYLNATLRNTEFIPAIPVLVWTEDAHKYALRARELAISNISDRKQALRLVGDIVSRINSVWERRADMEPSFESYERPKVLEILKLLPRSNCRECGLASCMAFADSLSKDKKALCDCPPLSDPERARELEALRGMGLPQ